MSIRTKLIITYLSVALIPAVFVGILTFHNYRESFETSSIEEMSELAAFKAEKIETYFTWVKSYMRSTQSFYNVKKNLPVLARLAGTPADLEYKAAKKTLDDQLRPLQADLSLNDILLLEPSGKVVYSSSGGKPRQDFAKTLPANWKKTLTEGRKALSLSEVALDPARERSPEMLVAAPLADLNGVFGGVVVFELNMAPVYRLTEDRAGLHETGEILLGGKREGGVVFLNHLRHDPAPALTKSIAFGNPEGLPMQKATQGTAGSGLSQDYRGREVVAGWRYIPSLGWGIVAKIDAAEAFADIDKLRHLLMLLLALTSAACCTIAVSLARSISEPIQKLSAGAGLIGAGNLDHKVGGGQADEIGQLGRAFDEMTANLKKTLASRDALDAEVRERKRAEKRQALLSGSAAALLETGEPQAAIQKICEETMEFLGCQVFFNYLYVAEKGRLFLNAYAGIPAAEAGRIEWLDYGVAVCGCVARDGKRIIAEHITAEKDPRTDLVRGYGVRAYCCHPLLAGKETLGTISFGAKDRDVFTADEVELMRATADLVAIAMQRKLNEQALEAERDNLRKIFDGVSVGMLLLDEKGAIVRANGAMAGWLGKAPEALLGTQPGNALRCVHVLNDSKVCGTTPDCRDCSIRGAFETVLRTGEPVTGLETLAELSDGGGAAKLWLEVNASPIVIGGKKNVLLALNDITARKLAGEERERLLQELRESESRVRLKIESIIAPEGKIDALELSDIIDSASFQRLMDKFYALASVPMALIDLKGKVLVGVGWQDICTRFHRANPETCAHCVESDTKLTDGVPQGEYRLYKCRNGMWDVATPIVLGGRHLGNLFIGQFFMKDAPPDPEFFRAQAKRYGFDEKEYLDALGRVPLMDRGSLDTTMGFFLRLAQMLSQTSFNNLKLARALTEREALTRSLEESEKRLNKAQEMAHLGSWELDLAANRLVWSDEVYRIFGLEPGEFPATYEAFLEAVHPDDRAAVDAAYSGSVRDGKDYYEIAHRVVRRSTGEVRYVLERCVHVRDAGGGVVRSVGMVHDITERRKAEDELKRSNENLEQFAYVASHDLQEPLRMMSSYSTLLARRYKGKLDQDAEDFIGFIVDGADRLQRLINDLLAYSRAGRLEHAGVPVDCQALLERVLAGMRLAIEDSGAAVTSDPLPKLAGNESGFAQLFQNLIGNAIKFHGPEKPQIHVGAVRKGGNWLFSVKDNGIGIEGQYKDRIFLIFQRLHGREEYPGTGIGLSICKKIVEASGGKIWLESEPGKGSTFYFTIPAKAKGEPHVT